MRILTGPLGIDMAGIGHLMVTGVFSGSGLARLDVGGGGGILGAASGVGCAGSIPSIAPFCVKRSFSGGIVYLSLFVTCFFSTVQTDWDQRVTGSDLG
jgi:hypothetical protein